MAPIGFDTLLAAILGIWNTYIGLDFEYLMLTCWCPKYPFDPLFFTARSTCFDVWPQQYAITINDVSLNLSKACEIWNNTTRPAKPKHIWIYIRVINVSGWLRPTALIIRFVLFCVFVFSRYSFNPCKSRIVFKDVYICLWWFGIL